MKEYSINFTQGVMYRIMSFICVFIFGTTVQLTAQIDTKSGQKLEQNVSEDIFEDAVKPYSHSLAPPPQNIQKLPLIIANTSIRYKSSATVYLHLKYADLARSFYLESSTNAKRVYVDVSLTGEAIIKNVPKATNFILFGVVDGKPFKIADVTTKPDAVGAVTVSRMLYQEVVKWQIMKPRPSFLNTCRQQTR